MAGVPVMVAVSRREVGSASPPKSLNPRQQDPSGQTPDLILPCLPARLEQAGKAPLEVFEDVALPAVGAYEYLVSGGDLWGRWSRWSKETFTYVDDREPPSPSTRQLPSAVTSSPSALTRKFPARV